MTGVDLVGVVVPARNEQDRIGACLDALRVARARCPVRTRVVVVLDRCVDATAAIMAGHPDTEVLVTSGAGGVGRARARGADLLLAGSDPGRTWLAHTDSDSRVPAGWLTQMARLADGGADLVLGTVEPDLPGDGELFDEWRSLHPAVEDHPYVFGANLGVRGSTYRAVGGFEHTGVGEDALLAGAVTATTGAVVVRTALEPVRTSGRLHSTVAGGFADYLAELKAVASGHTPAGHDDNTVDLVIN